MSWAAILIWAVGIPVAFHLIGWAVYFGVVLAKVGCKDVFSGGCFLSIAITSFAWEDDLVEFLFSGPAVTHTPAHPTPPGRLVTESPDFASDNA